MLRAGIVSMLLAISPAVAQEVIDNSGSDVPPEELEATLSSVSARLSDPMSAQFRGLFLSSGGLVCGEVNNKDAAGADLGFIPFGYNTHDDSVTLLIDSTSIASAADAATLSEGGCTWLGGHFEENRPAE
jgi:hypothetical protein